ncbi:MAG: orotidine-5'-phosphate decarboxylase [Mobilicoccus sp.]|nr:orotidine-5'-phosphate decarboxylase [Mobilicoccus sp.]
MFGQRLTEAVTAHGPLCAGIDPHAALLEQWGLADDIEGLRTFARTCVEAFAGTVACVKPQSAFFERFGSAGVAVLEQTLADLRAAGTLTVLDVKRGDIGSTMAGYARAHLGPDAPLWADAITLSPYLGYDSLRPALDLAAEHGHGAFVLALTSNPEGRSVQHAQLDGTSVAGSVVAGVSRDNAAAIAAGHLGSVGMVVGATVGSAVADLGLDLAAAGGPLLAPGIGAQGATGADLRDVFGDARRFVLASSSRDVLSAGPDTGALAARARDVAEQVRAMLNG